MSFDIIGFILVVVNVEGVFLVLIDVFVENLNVMFVFWKDYIVVKEVSEIIKVVNENDVNYLFYMGGIYLFEWYWVKVLYIFCNDLEVKVVIYSWVEYCDWMIVFMCGIIYLL